VLGRLVATRPVAVERAFEMLERREGRRGLLVQALGSIPRQPALLARARPLVAQALEEGFGDELRHAILAAVHLGAGEALSRIVDMAGTGEEAVQAAALRAIPQLIGHGDEGLQTRARETVADALLSAEEDALAAAITAANYLKVPELADALPDLVSSDHPPNVRMAALQAIPGYLPRTSGTVELLIECLKDPALRRNAHRALMRVARTRLPARVDMWKSWLQRANLPAEAPAEEEDEY
jgi:hypothetical protein